jgi:uncharacterized delta-60 repeat protein
MFKKDVLKSICIIPFLLVLVSCSKSTDVSIKETPVAINPIIPEIIDKFETGDGFTNTILASEIDADGKLICAGLFRTFKSKNVNFIVRLNKDGSLDSSFNAPKDINSWIRDIFVQTDGKIIIGGDNSIFFRLNIDGSIDKSFNTGKGFSYNDFGYDNTFINNGNNYSKGAEIVQFIPNKDGSLFVLGGFDYYNSKKCSNNIIKLKPDGTIDESFNPNAITNGMDTRKSNAIFPNGNLLITNISLTNYTFRFPFSITQNGIIDTVTYKPIGDKFNNNNSYPSISTSTIQNDGKILIGGLFDNIRGIFVNNIARIKTDGSVDEQFKIGSGFNGPVDKIQLQNDGKILVAGQFTKYNNTTQNHLVRLNSDGTIDNSFNSGLGFTDLQNSPNNVFNFNIRSDGKIYITGGFLYYNGIKKPFAVRINSDGTL